MQQMPVRCSTYVCHPQQTFLTSIIQYFLFPKFCHILRHLVVFEIWTRSRILFTLACCEKSNIFSKFCLKRVASTWDLATFSFAYWLACRCPHDIEMNGYQLRPWGTHARSTSRCSCSWHLDSLYVISGHTHCLHSDDNYGERTKSPS